MRTRLTLDEDVAALLRREQARRTLPLRQIVNAALRVGLARPAVTRQTSAPYRTPSVSLGNCLVGGVDDIAGTLAIGEGDHFR